MNTKIKTLILNFPHGASVTECDLIARKTQSIVKANVSEGGFMPTNKYGIYVDDVTFSEDTMYYDYGYNKINTESGGDE